MRSLYITGPKRAEFTTVPEPEPAATDIVIQVKACGVCGTDAHFWQDGLVTGTDSPHPIGHEIAGEVVYVGAAVTDTVAGDHVVVNPMPDPGGIIGCGGIRGGLTERLLIPNAHQGITHRVVPAEIPWEVAALNEPMAVAYHGVNRSGAGVGTKAVVFGAGPVGLGAAIGLKHKGAAHVVVVDVVQSRLDNALQIGADAVINSATEDIAARLRELHGTSANLLGAERAGTDVYIDAAGVPAVIRTALANMKAHGVLTVIALHKQDVPIDFQEALMVEADIRLSMSYPTEIFEVTDSIIADWQKYQRIISDIVPFGKADEAVRLAATPGATDKVVVVMS
ncbi:zinc-binding dehydrogenase [Streptomyces sp. NPDC006655]|uniref:zinc-dependent alcohol dehydrogenase n=1 Tax=Streptomyces sp. NPDC006655 TaxID=3156898 RepID=UPI0034558B88